jgi:hypothetical protein
MSPPRGSAPTPSVSCINCGPLNCEIASSQALAKHKPRAPACSCFSFSTSRFPSSLLAHTSSYRASCAYPQPLFAPLSERMKTKTRYCSCVPMMKVSEMKGHRPFTELRLPLRAGWLRSGADILYQ